MGRTGRRRGGALAPKRRTQAARPRCVCVGCATERNREVPRGSPQVCSATLMICRLKRWNTGLWGTRGQGDEAQRQRPASAAAPMRNQCCGQLFGGWSNSSSRVAPGCRRSRCARSPRAPAAPRGSPPAAAGRRRCRGPRCRQSRLGGVFVCVRGRGGQGRWGCGPLDNPAGLPTDRHWCIPLPCPALPAKARRPPVTTGRLSPGAAASSARPYASGVDARTRAPGHAARTAANTFATAAGLSRGPALSSFQETHSMGPSPSGTMQSPALSAWMLSCQPP
jgi:hypothetical protein